ncbi:MAG TPA: zf-HC2 domain-containing protein, partial [Planctomycetota bacterium]|nr:zf-HC2 domain-containing protein [Planctomycetota bacterium]
MRCEEAEPHLAAYIDGELDASLARSIEGHLRECRACRESVRDLRLASAVLTKWRSARPTESMVEVIRKRIAAEEAAPARPAAVSVTEIRRERRVRARRRWFTRTRLVVAAAAAVLVAGFAGFVSWWTVPSTAPRTTREEIRAVAAIALKVERVEDVRQAGMTLEGAAADLWSERKPRPRVIVPLEVVGTMLSRAGGPAEAKDAARLLELLGEKGLASRAADGVGAFADATGDCLVALLSLSEAAAQDAPAPLPTLLDEAMRLETSGDLEGAVANYRACQQAAADRLLALRSYIHQANLEMKLGRAEAAVEALDRAFEMTRPDTFNRDVVNELRRRADRAIELRTRIDALKRELLRTERDFELWSEIGDLQVKAGDLKGARGTFDHIVTRYDTRGHRDDHLRARLMRAWCDSRMNRLGEAQDDFDRLVGDASGVFNDVAILAQFERARTLQLRGYTAEALKDYRDLMSAYPDLPVGCRAALEFQVGYVRLREQGDVTGA